MTSSGDQNLNAPDLGLRRAGVSAVFVLPAAPQELGHQVESLDRRPHEVDRRSACQVERIPGLDVEVVYADDPETGGRPETFIPPVFVPEVSRKHVERTQSLQ